MTKLMHSLDMGAVQTYLSPSFDLRRSSNIITIPGYRKDICQAPKIYCVTAKAAHSYVAFLWVPSPCRSPASYAEHVSTRSYLDTLCAHIATLLSCENICRCECIDWAPTKRDTGILALLRNLLCTGFFDMPFVAYRLYS